MKSKVLRGCGINQGTEPQIGLGTSVCLRDKGQPHMSQERRFDCYSQRNRSRKPVEARPVRFQFDRMDGQRSISFGSHGQYLRVAALRSASMSGPNGPW